MADTGSCGTFIHEGGHYVALAGMSSLSRGSELLFFLIKYGEEKADVLSQAPSIRGMGWLYGNFTTWGPAKRETAKNFRSMLRKENVELYIIQRESLPASPLDASSPSAGKCISVCLSLIPQHRDRHKRESIRNHRMYEW